jgi:uncharacterized protein
MIVHRWDIVMVAGCNLRCTYCATAHGSFGRQAEGVMSLETAEALAEWIARCADPSHAKVRLGFGGGETFLHFDRFIGICDLIVGVSRAKGVRVHIHVTTNGVLLDEARLRKLAKRGIDLTFSIDGPEEVHDMNRRTAAGERTFKPAYGNWRRYRTLARTMKPSPRSSIRSVFTQESGPLRKICDYWLRQGVPLQEIAPANASRLNGLAGQGSGKRIQDGYFKGLREWALEQADACTAMTFLGGYRGPRSVYTGWRRLLLGTEKQFCTPAQGVLAVGCDGGLYPCEPYIGVAQWKLGDLFNGLDSGKVAAFVASCVRAQTHCEGCRHRLACEKVCFGLIATDTPLQNVKRSCRGLAKRDARITEQSFRKLMRNSGTGGS